MVSKEGSVYLETAEEQLKDAQLVLKTGRYALCVFLSASCAENATSALLITLGAKPSKKHRNSLVLYRLALSVPKLREDLLKITELMKALEPHVTKARYPIRKGLELLPPNKYYTKEDAEEVMANAKKVVNKAKQLVRKNTTVKGNSE